MSELLTVAEVALVLKCSEDAVVRRFAHVDGVIDLGQAETRDKRRYRVLRVPKAVLEKYLSKKAGHPVKVEVPDRPDRPERRRKSVNWEDRATLNLAKAGLQNECTDKAVFRRIADKARVFTLVPESLWVEALSSWRDEHEEEG
jgi:hypothetical protein